MVSCFQMTVSRRLARWKEVDVAEKRKV